MSKKSMIHRKNKKTNYTTPRTKETLMLAQLHIMAISQASTENYEKKNNGDAFFYETRDTDNKGDFFIDF